LVKWPIHQDIWLAIEYGLQHFARHPDKDNNTCPHPPFGSSLRVNHIILNNAVASQMSVGSHNLMKDRISKEWSKLWSKAMGLHLAKTCECVMIHALWNHSYRLCIFRNNEDHKNGNRAVAEYKQKELDDNIGQLYMSFTTRNLPLNPLQRSQFDIQQDQLLLLSYYDTSRAWLRSADLYLSCAMGHDDFFRGCQKQFILHHSFGSPPYILNRQ
jgi:hypothetical protein